MRNWLGANGRRARRSPSGVRSGRRGAGSRRPRLRRQGLQVRSGETCRTEAALLYARPAEAGRGGQDHQRGPDPARHRRVGPPVPVAAVRRRAAGPGRPARPGQILHHPARRHRPRRLVEALRRPEDGFPALRLRRYGRGAPRTGDQGPGRPEAAAGPGDVDGLHAHLRLGRGRFERGPGADAAGLPERGAGRPQRLWRSSPSTGSSQIRRGGAETTRASRRRACARPRAC